MKLDNAKLKEMATSNMRFAFAPEYAAAARIAAVLPETHDLKIDVRDGYCVVHAPSNFAYASFNAHTGRNIILQLAAGDAKAAILVDLDAPDAFEQLVNFIK